MTREGQEQLHRARRARHFLGLPHSADSDDVSFALRYIESRDQTFQATKRRHSKLAKRAARSLVQALMRGQCAGLPMPAGWQSLVNIYWDIATTKSGPPKRADGFRQQLALQQAYWLLTNHNRPCHASLNGDWCKLAAILLGHPKATAGLVSQARQLQTRWKLAESKPGQN
jgi:hypothetical protein